MGISELGSSGPHATTQGLSGEKVSVLSYICHNSGGQLLKKRQSEMWLTARLFRPRLSCTVARRGVRSRKRYKYKCGGRREQHQNNTEHAVSDTV
ncbi:hypothetical protein T06_11602 [Trichinella sp. T6]|nr:hypothetical protein T06_11602 [Trichinella sp. T6]